MIKPGRVILAQITNDAKESKITYSWASDGLVNVNQELKDKVHEFDFLPAEVRDSLKRALENKYKSLSLKERNNFIGNWHGQLSKIQHSLPIDLILDLEKVTEEE